MPTVTTETRRVDGVTFVEVRIAAETSHRIRLESRLDGPVLSPRSGSEAAGRWEDGALTRTVSVGVTGVGFATPAPPADPAVELAAAEPVGEPPRGIATWLDRVEERVRTAETLAAADDLPAATKAVEAAGGLAAVEELAAALERDRRVLGDLSFVSDELRRRAETVEVPTATLARIAEK